MSFIREILLLTFLTFFFTIAKSAAQSVDAGSNLLSHNYDQGRGTVCHLYLTIQLLTLLTIIFTRVHCFLLFVVFFIATCTCRGRYRISTFQDGEGGRTSSSLITEVTSFLINILIAPHKFTTKYTKIILTKAIKLNLNHQSGMLRGHNF